MPNVGDFVTCKIIEVRDIGSYAELLEYDNIVGLIGITELSKQRIRSITQVVNVNKIVVAQVISVDKERKYIDLSKKSVSSNDAQKHMQYYEKSKALFQIIKKYAYSIKETQEDRDLLIQHIYSEYIWNWSHNMNHNIDYLKDCVKQSKVVINDDFLSFCQTSLKSKTVCIYGIMTLVCYNKDGIEAVKNILKKITTNYSKDQLYITYLPASQYVFKTNTCEQQDGVEFIRTKMEEALKEMQKIDSGDGKITTFPKVLTNEKDLIAKQEEDCKDKIIFENDVSDENEDEDDKY